MIPVLKLVPKWQYLYAFLFLPSFLFGQSLTNTSTITITKTWSQEPSGYTYPLDIHVPTGTVPQGGFPVCITLHRGGKEGEVTEWSNILPNHIIVAPTGYKQSWNIAEESSEAPDVEMVGDLINSLQTYENVDANKIRILGTSLGAALANRMLIENQDEGVDIICAVVAHLTEASYHNNGFYLPSGDTGDGGTGVPLFEGYDTQTPPISGRKYLNISNSNDGIIPYKGGTSNVGLNFLDAQEAAFIVASSQGYTGAQVMDSTQIGSDNVYEFSYLSDQVVHLKGDAMHATNATQVGYLQEYFGEINTSTSDTTTDTTTETDTTTSTETETDTDTTTIIVTDTDNDGLNSLVDCNDNDATIGAKRSPGFPCDDGNMLTEGDRIQMDSCTCLGVNPCDLNGGDADLDGICAADDCNDANQFIGAKQEPGADCNDGNPNTENDQIQANGCDCSGIIINPDICLPPTESVVIAGINNSVTVEWTNRTSARSYTFQIRFKGKASWLITATSEFNKAIISGPSRTYEYRVKTNCLDGSESEYSSIFDLTLPFTNVGLLPSKSRNYTTPIKEIIIEDTALLYPNPTSDRINLEYSPISEDAIFVVYDKMGRQLFNQPLSILSTSYLFDVTRFQSGIYLGAVFERGELQFSQQFYKQ